MKSATDELLWIWQKKSNNIHDLDSHIWDEWADGEGSIGKAYGYQFAKKHPCKDVTEEGLTKAFPGYLFEEYSAVTAPGCDAEPDNTGNTGGAMRVCIDTDTGRIAAMRDNNGPWHLDQVDKVIYDLKVNPFSRRIITTLWDPEELDDMALQPCAWNCVLWWSKDRDTINSHSIWHSISARRTFWLHGRGTHVSMQSLCICWLRYAAWKSVRCFTLTSIVTSMKDILMQ